MNDWDKLAGVVLCWVVGTICAYCLGRRSGMKTVDDGFAKKIRIIRKNRVVDLSSLLYRVVETENGKWRAQHKVNGEWNDCKDKYGDLVERDNAASARHWFFWEDGSKQFPDAGTDDQVVYRYKKDGTRIPEDDEE